MRLKITPYFSSKEIIDNTIRKTWFEFQNSAFELGKRIHAYMINYISTRKHRRGGQGLLEKSIDFVPITGAGSVGWGIGTIANLPPYWYVINYGKMITGGEFIPAKGKFVPGSFEGNRPDPAMAGGVERFNKGDGTGYGMYPKRPVRPINYIQATRARLNASLRSLIRRLKRT